MSKRASNVVQLHPIPDWMHEPAIWRVDGDHTETEGSPTESRGFLQRKIGQALDWAICELSTLRKKL